MSETNQQERVVIVIDVESTEDAQRAAQERDRRLERLIAPALREHQRMQRLIDMARPRHLAFVEERLRVDRGLARDAALYQTAQGQQYSVIEAAKRETDSLRRLFHAADPIDKLRPLFHSAERLAVDYRLQMACRTPLPASEFLRARDVPASWTVLARNDAPSSSFRFAELCRFRNSESLLMRKLLESSFSPQFDLVREANELRGRLDRLESFRLPSEWMEGWWAEQDAAIIQNPETDKDEKTEAWIGLLDFMENRLGLQNGYVPRFVYQEGGVEDLDELFSPSEALMRELESGRWRNALRPIQYLRAAVFKEADRFYKKQLMRRRQHHQRVVPIEDGSETPETGLAGVFSAGVRESDLVSRIDWQRACSGIHPDQREVLQALYDGIRQTDLALFLGWDRRRAERVLKSLSPDRRAGRALRNRLLAYRN